LLLAIVFDWASYYTKYSYLTTAVHFALLAGFITALAACVFGYLLSLSGDYNARTVGNHLRAGLLLTFFTGLLVLAGSTRLQDFVRLPRRVLSVLFAALALLMAYTGHQGATLTHGDNYLTIETLTKKDRPRPVTAEAAMIFEDVVQPMLQTRCGQCHQAGKLKGKLSVASLAGLLKGGKHGAAVVPGKLNESELFKRITLDPDHEEFMPSDGKTPLTKNEVEIIRWWIDKAMAAEGKQLAVFTSKERILPRVAVYLGISKTLPEETAGETAATINPAIPLTADTAAIHTLQQKGLVIRVMLHRPLMLDITMPANAGVALNQLTAGLQSIEKNIVWLNLSGNNLTEKELGFLHRLSNLEKLRLEKNRLGDAIVEQLLPLQHLETVNLNETNITNQGLAMLQKNAAIKRIYTWNTSVTASK
jgi:hypothetical protein